MRCSLDNNEQSAIEEEFSKSWDGIEKFFVEVSTDFEWINPIFNLIAELRKRGYDQKFRAGQAMTAFVLSRSRKHGLHIGQASLGITLMPDGSMTLNYGGSDGEVKIETKRAEFTPELESLLERLAAHPID
jgi:hypothetical protein